VFKLGVVTPMTPLVARPHETSQRIAGDPFAERPFLVFWEVTRACALACSHCRAEAQHHRDPLELSCIEAERLVDQLAELKPPMLILTGGDPMMRPDVLDIAARASAAGLRVGLSPSATARLMNSDFHAIRAAGIERMSLSLDGATRETHDAFRGVRGTFDRTLRAMEMANDAGISLQINTTLTKGNLAEFPAFRDLMFEWKPAMWSVFILVPTGRAGIDDLPDPDDLERVFEEMADLVGKAPFSIKTTEGHHFRRVLAQRGKGGPASRPGFRAPLGIRDGRGVMFISHTGVVSPSGFLPVDCGNARERHVAEIYREHPLFISLRDSDALGGKCGRCEFRRICGGSRSRAYGVTSDPFAEDPSCNYQPGSRRAAALSH
jgi:radical SAM protein with 4Fe4S-binding SPASM domain